MDTEDGEEILEPVRARFARGWGSSVDCARGWWPIIVQLDRDIATIAPDYEVHQIKEKFGGLRFYYGFGEAGFDPRIDALVAAAEEVAARTCEYCGAPGTARGGGWIKTLCDNHARDRADRKGGNGASAGLVGNG